MDFSDNSLQMSARRRVMYGLMAATCQEAGFASAEKHTLEVLLQMFQSFLTELCISTKQFSEHAGRSDPLPGDVFMALIEMGFDVQSTRNYAFRPNRHILPSPLVMPKQQPPKILQTGIRKPLLNFIPDYFPPFPDSHSYISTPTHKQPITDYETLREKSSMQKRDVERALTRFMARTFTSPFSYSLFPDAQLSHLFPLIGIKNDIVPYLSVLISKDHIWNNDSNQFHFLNDANNKSNLEENRLNDSLDNTKEAEDSFNEIEMVDNPFLRAPKQVNF